MSKQKFTPRDKTKLISKLITAIEPNPVASDMARLNRVSYAISDTEIEVLHELLSDFKAYSFSGLMPGQASLTQVQTELNFHKNAQN